jgi:predicted permease
VIVAKVIGIFAIVFIGYGANKIGWLPVQASRYFSVLIINVSAPCMLVMSVAGRELTGANIRAILLMFLIAVLGYLGQWLFAKLFIRIRRIPRTEWGVYINALVFTNSGFMGFAVALAIFGTEGLFLIAMMNATMPLFLYTAGTAFFRKDAAAINGVIPARESFGAAFRKAFNAPIIGTLIGLAVFFFRVPIPAAVGDVLSMLGGLMTPLSMIVVGLQLTQSRPREMIGNKNLLFVVFFRLILLPVIALLILLPFRLSGTMTAVATLNFLLPCAAILPALAEEAGANAKLAAEATFLTTLFSVITVPVASVLLHLL